MLQAVGFEQRLALETREQKGLRQSGGRREGDQENRDREDRTRGPSKRSRKAYYVEGKETESK